MNHFKKKLLSRCGSSMILALVFLMFCTFVGGSVLAMASANSARVKHLTQEEQQFLNQRSAVRLLRDQFTAMYTPVDGDPAVPAPEMRLTVHVVTSESRQVEMLDGGITRPVDNIVRRSVHFQFSAVSTANPKPAVQRLVYENAILRVLDVYNYNATSDSLSMENLTFLPASGTTPVTLNVLEDLMMAGSNGTDIQVTLTEIGAAEPLTNQISAKVLCQGGSKPYHFWATFGENGRDAQVSLRAQALVAENPGQQNVPYLVEKNDGTIWENTETASTITISWGAPEIVKGGLDG